MLDRLKLDDGRVDGIVQAIREIAALPDPVGQVTRSETHPNGMTVEKVRIPLGLIAMIYEARPNVTADAAALCLRAGNAVLLRGGSEARESNIRSEEHTSELQSLMRISYAVFCLKKKKT